MFWKQCWHVLYFSGQVLFSSFVIVAPVAVGQAWLCSLLVLHSEFVKASLLVGFWCFFLCCQALAQDAGAHGQRASQALKFLLAGWKPDFFLPCFLVDALANHFDIFWCYGFGGMGWGAVYCVHVDSEQKRLRWCQALTVGNILRDGFFVGIRVTWYVMGLGWGGVGGGGVWNFM